jgi:hypothetical protein
LELEGVEMEALVGMAVDTKKRAEGGEGGGKAEGGGMSLRLEW